MIRDKGMLKKLLIEKDYVNKKIVFVCIGTDRATGDCLGPLVGTFLNDKNYIVYGTLENPIHAKNLEKRMKEIEEIHSNDIIIAIDASLGKEEDISKVYISDEPVHPRSAIDNSFKGVGDMSITGIVNFSGFLPHTILQNTRFNVVYDMAKEIVKEINYTFRSLKITKTHKYIK